MTELVEDCCEQVGPKAAKCCDGGSDCWCWIEKEAEPQRWPGALENATARRLEMERIMKEALSMSDVVKLENRDTREITGYMCKIDWDYELGRASDGNSIYPSEDALRAQHSCADECGIVEVVVRLSRVIKETDLAY